MSAVKTITVSELRREMSSILHRVVLLGETYQIEKNGRVYATLSRPDDRGDSDHNPQDRATGSGDLIRAEEVLAEEKIT